MADLKFNRIASSDYFPAGDRLHMTMNIMEKTMVVFVHGREAKDVERNTALWMYQNALTQAERQIISLQHIIREISPGFNDVGIEDYLEQYEDLSLEEEFDYKLEDLKESLFVAMAKNDEKKQGLLLNQISLLEEKKSRILEKEVQNDNG